MRKSLSAVLLALALASTVTAQISLDVEVQNLQPAGGLFLTPVWVGFHDGSFDTFTAGEMASSALETIAEDGDPGPLAASFMGQGVDGVVAPNSPFGPAGSSFAGQATATFNVPTTHRYFSYASMIIPSNDAFVANDNPTGIQVFDSGGNFTGPLVIDILGQHIHDAGTEVNNGQGAAFSALGGSPTDEALPIAFHAGLDNFIGTGTANGESIQSAFSQNTPIARITISETIPEPSSLLLLGMAMAGVAFFDPRRTKK